VDQPIQFPVVLAGKYNLFEHEHEGLRVEVASYAVKKKRAMEQIANNIHSLIGFYKKFLGDYPFDEMKVIEIDSYGWAVAPAGVIFITREAFEPGLQSRGWSGGLNRRLAHEVAHTWWGHVAKMSSREDQWLSESTAEYFSAFASSQLVGKREFEDALREWRQQSGHVGDKASLYLANQLAGEESYGDRYALLYAKGPLVLHALRQELGDQKFFTLFKSYLTNYSMQHIQTRDLIKMTSWVAGTDYAPWFDRYLFGVEWPEVDKRKKK
jgi:hypothetical protein